MADEEDNKKEFTKLKVITPSEVQEELDKMMNETYLQVFKCVNEMVKAPPDTPKQNLKECEKLDRLVDNIYYISGILGRLNANIYQLSQLMGRQPIEGAALEKPIKEQLLEQMKEEQEEAERAKAERKKKKKAKEQAEE